MNFRRKKIQKNNKWKTQKETATTINTSTNDIECSIPNYLINNTTARKNSLQLMLAWTTQNTHNVINTNIIKLEVNFLSNLHKS
jgi:hypothetical protein